MKNKKNIEILQSELFAIVKENTLTPSTLTNHQLRSPSSSIMINFSFSEIDRTPQYSYFLTTNTLFLDISDIASDDDLYFIDSISLEGFLNIEKHFNLIDNSNVLAFMQTAYDKVHEMCDFAFGKKHIGLKRPEIMGDILDYVHYDGDNYCIRYEIYQSNSNYAYYIALYPVVNLQKRSVTLAYQIITDLHEYNDYEHSLNHFFELYIFSKIGKNKEDLTPEDSLVLQMLYT